MDLPLLHALILLILGFSLLTIMEFTYLFWFSCVTFVLNQKKNAIKKILFILFVSQFILAPYIIKGYGANLVEDNYEYSGVAQGRETVEKDILGNIIIRDDKGNRTTIKKDIFGNEIIEYGNGHGKIIKKDIFGNTVIEEY